MFKLLTPEEINYATERLNEYGHIRPDVITLAMLSSVARRIEPELLRALRLAFSDRFPAEYRPTVATEAALWFSLLVESRGPDNITLLPEFSLILRDRLKADQTLLKATYDVIKNCHQFVSPVISWEEDLVFLNLDILDPESDRKKNFEQNILRAIKAISEDDRPSLEEWIVEMRNRLPETANNNPLMALLQGISKVNINRRNKHSSNSRYQSDLAVSDLLELPTMVIDVLKIGSSFRIGHLSGSGQFGIRVPDTQSIIIDVLQPDGSNDVKSLVILPGEFIDIPIQSSPIRIRTIDGQIYLLDPKLFDDNDRYEQNEIHKIIQKKQRLQPEKVLKGHVGQVWGVAVTPDRKKVISGSYDQTLRVWDLRSGMLIKTINGHTDKIFGVAAMPDGRSAVSCSADQTIKVWNLESGACIKTLKGHIKGVYCVAVTPDGQNIISGSFDKTLRIWDLKTERCAAILDEHSDSIFCVAVTPDGRYAISASGDKTIRVWDLKTYLNILTLEGHSDSVDCIAVSPDGRYVISGSRDNTVRIWDLKSAVFEEDSLQKSENSSTMRNKLEILMREEFPDSWFSSNDLKDRYETVHGDIELSTVSKYLLKMLRDGAVERRGKRKYMQYRLMTEDFSLDVKHPRTVSKEASWSKGFAILDGHGGAITGLAVTSDGQRVLTSSFDRTMRIYDLNNKVCIKSIELNNCLLRIAIASDDEIVSSSDDNSLWVCQMPNDFDAPADLSRIAPPIESKRSYVNAKVVLLGEGAVGKTSLAYRLIEDKFVVKDRTHGMNVWSLELPLPTDATMDCEAQLWDLAGQEGYQLIHQSFLDQTALALLLINPSKDDPFADTEYWLKMLETAAGNQAAKREVPKLLIFSQVDVGGMKISNAKIERFAKEHGFADWLATSAKTGQNCSDEANGGKPSKLKQLIANHIPWKTLPWTSTSHLVDELKRSLAQMRNTAGIRLLRFAEMVHRLEQAMPGASFDEPEVRMAVSLLANQGMFLPLKFGDLVLLQPELLNDYAGAIIRAARSHKDEIGCVLEADIYKQDFDFAGVDRLARPDEELLLRATVQTFLEHSLCISEDTAQGRQLFFPSLYRREKDIPREPDIFVSYTFGGEWQTIWTTLVVRLWYSQEFEHKELWRNAAEFKSSRGNLFGLKIDNRQGEGEATISLFFDPKTPDELKVIFIEYVHRHLARYGEVTRDRRYVCACGKPVTDQMLVQKRLAAGKNFIICQGCDEKVELIDFIEQRLKSDPVARKILAMEETATRQLDNQALEQILIGHMMAVCGEANQVFRPMSMFDYGIDGEVEFRDNNGQPSGKKIYVQLKSGNSYLRTRRKDGQEVFDVNNDRHLDYWMSQPVDVYLVIRQTEERTGEEAIRWMNVTRYLRDRKDKKSRQIIFDGEDLNMHAVWKLRDTFFQF